MRILMVSKACIVGAYQKKLEELSRMPEMALTVVVPPYWRDDRGVIDLERQYTPDLLSKTGIEMQMKMAIESHGLDDQFVAGHPDLLTQLAHDSTPHCDVHLLR